ncbi:MAG: hypothetical protein GTN76_10585 [Candidatus Aenigmarchaeota archaeon]|nr:hypothetical protein [Candidatus Aenigmarchaeota archaeon]
MSEKGKVKDAIVLTREIRRVSVKSIFQTQIDRLARLVSEPLMDVFNKKGRAVAVTLPVNKLR